MEQQQPPLPPDPKKGCWTSAVASFMSRRIRHIHAKSNEWIHVKRGSGGGGGGSGDGPGALFVVATIILVVWLAYKVFVWTVEIVRASIAWTAELLVTITPFLLLAIIIGAVIYYCFRRSY